MKFIKFIAISRFNYIDCLTIGIATGFGVNEHYISAAITVLLMSLISAVAENYVEENQ